MRTLTVDFNGVRDSTVVGLLRTMEGHPNLGERVWLTDGEHRAQGSVLEVGDHLVKAQVDMGTWETR